MNLLVLKASQFIHETKALPNSRQCEHILRILKPLNGDKISLGLVNGDIGEGTIVRNADGLAIEDIAFVKPPPPTLPLTLILGMPRPQMLKRILQTVACMGVEKLCLIQSSRVEKSFWQSPSATDAAIEEQLILGLEQGVATQMPVVEKHLRFRPFIEDALLELSANTQAVIAHPGGKAAPEARSGATPMCLAVGPEGGFLEKEVASFSERGFRQMDLGRRILKVETAIPVLLAKLYETVF